MSNYQKGVLGAFSGLVGTVVGATFRTIEVMRSRPKKSTKPAKQSQINQRTKFGLMTAFLSRVKTFIDMGFKPSKKTHSPMNSAVQYNMLNAITGVAPNFKIDYSKLLITNGKLNSVSNVTLALNAAGRLELKWSTAYENLFEPEVKLIRDKDTARLFIYSEDTDYSLTTGKGALRSSGTMVTLYPSEGPGETLHVWIFFVSEDKKEATSSRYLGTIVSTI